ncbi:sigma 54-interacting transcriptional regulator [Agathobaculum sp.]|uniref:sigma 54-interacting transcriptional regulator n=1 Tax=Agathobaculum sp. TaxID=2048138 RepID=UPI002A82916E|nr:sigma 54-interacting transcriptional regulator [Agathobaculum sp.]MDY3617605.1 sigma 54-interacting transcriptional regulator [Agathobaculum sp.]
MIRIMMAVPFEDMTDLAYAVWAEAEQFAREQQWDEEEYEFTVAKASTTQEVFRLEPDVDVVIARGATAYDLQRNHFHIPVVELMISANDLLQTILQVRETYGNIPAAFIGSPNMFEGIDRLAESLQIDCQPFYLKENTEEEIYRNVEAAVDSGRRVIIGGMRGCIYARNFGVHHMLLRSSRDSIWNAIMSARQLGVTSRRNKEYVLSNQAMLDNAFEGLISLNKNHCITALSTSAKKILNLAPGDWCIGMSIRDVLRSPRITALVNSPEPYADEIIAYNNTHLSFKKVGLKLHGEPVGCVLTFLNASQIQETEIKLRGKLYEHGHVAKYTFDTLIGESEEMGSTIAVARAYAKTNSDIMLVGESGTGKELFSQSIHNASLRSAHPFVAVNCAAIPENLLESELFGYVGGAFTGANKNGKIGLFEQAHHGTIFLDEISEIPLPLQGRLLRVLQEREVMRLGHDRVIPVDVRVICATNKDLHEQVQKGLFREDLLYRIYVLSLRIPPLRERKGDIPLLVEHFAGQFCAREGRERLFFTAEALDMLEAQPWRGNIRELQNFCERVVVLHQGGEIDAAFVARLLSYDRPASSFPQAEASPENTEPIEPERILKALEKSGGNKSMAAELLGVSRATLWRHLKKMQQP